MKYAKGVCWIGDCRIPFVDEVVGGGKKATTIFGGDAGYEHDGFTTNDTGGRFTPNLLVCDNMLNDGVITKTTQKNKVVGNTRQMFNYSTQREYPEINDKGTNSRYYDLDKWFDKMIDEL